MQSGREGLRPRFSNALRSITLSPVRRTARRPRTTTQQRTEEMTNVVDWILDLFRDPVQAQNFINDPDRAVANAGVQGVTAAQVNAVAATVAPAAVIHGGGDPVYGLQQAVAETHGLAFTPQYAPSFAPETQALSNNDTLSHNDVLSNNDPHILSPEAGHDVQQGGVNLDFGDV